MVAGEMLYPPVELDICKDMRTNDGVSIAYVLFIYLHQNKRAIYPDHHCGNKIHARIEQESKSHVATPASVTCFL